jgi:hypothetical protein
MRQMAADYSKKGVLFVGINSNKTEPEDEVKAHASQNKWAFTLAKDPGNKVADLYDAKRTPEVYVVGADGKLLYHGRIDENYEEPTKVTSPDLKNALDQILAGQPVAKAETKAFGCTIKRAGVSSTREAALGPPFVARPSWPPEAPKLGRARREAPPRPARRRARSSW